MQDTTNDHIGFAEKVKMQEQKRENTIRWYTITVDTEEEWDWNSGYPTLSNSVNNIRALPEFQEACDRFNARVTYFVNYTVLADDSAATVVMKLAENPNVEIAMHIHPWNTPPLVQSRTVPVRESFLHNLSRDEAIAKLDSVLNKFLEFGLHPTSFRGGRYSTSTWIQDYLFRQGVVADASILPFTTWQDEGAPDFRHRGLRPHRRDMGPGKHGFWEVPLTLAFTRKNWPFWQRFYEHGQHPIWKALHLIGIAERTFVNRVWLNLEHPLGEFSDRLLLKLRGHSLPCINFTLHSSSLVPGLNPYVRSDDDLRQLYKRLEDNLAVLIQWPEFKSATVTEVAHCLESDFHACSGN